jgi:membrane protease YdiL (CAAX protease family)
LSSSGPPLDPGRDGAAANPEPSAAELLVPPTPPGPLVPAVPTAGDPPSDGPTSDERPARAGTTTFTIEGRSAPALFVVGWLASLIGLGLTVVAVLSGGGTATAILFVIGLVLLSIGLVAAAGSQGIERRVRGALPYVGPSPFLVMVAAIPPVIAVHGVVAALILVGILPRDGPLTTLILLSLEALIYVGLVRLLVVDPGALDWRAMKITRLHPGAFTDIALGALLALPIIFVTGLVAAVLTSIFPVAPVSPLPPTGDDVGLAISLLAAVIVAPLAEEILFRGFATTAWALGIGPRRAVVRAALVFAFAHVLPFLLLAPANEVVGLVVVGFGARVPVALALGWIFERRGSIWASFGLHAAFNGVILLAAEAVFRSTGAG